MSADKWPDELLERVSAHYAAVAASSEDELIGVWVAATHQLLRRGLVRSIGNVPADLAESIVEKWSGGTRTPGSTAAVDVIGPAPAHTTYQVKSVRRTDPGRNSVATLSSFDFDELVVIVFEFDLSLRVGLRVSSDDLKRHRRELLTGSEQRRLTLTRKFCHHPAVRLIPRADLLRLHPVSAAVEWDPPRWEPEKWRPDQME